MGVEKYDAGSRCEHRGLHRADNVTARGACRLSFWWVADSVDLQRLFGLRRILKSAYRTGMDYPAVLRDRERFRLY
jgi:hypothetical protein